jgi:acetoacetate decarboxylase
MGKLAKNMFGFSMPISKNASLYTRHPFHYKDVSRLVITYESELEPVLDVLPELIEPLTDPPQVVVTVSDVGFHIPLGPYVESYIAIRAKFKEESIRYILYMWVTSDAAMAAGREIYGAPKKLANVSLFNREPNTEIYQGIVERPIGNKLFALSALLTAKADPNEIESEPPALLKVIPDALNEKEPAIADLLKVESSYEFISDSGGEPEFYKGIGSVDFCSNNQTEPVYELKPKKIISTYYMKVNIFENNIALLHRY